MKKLIIALTSALLMCLLVGCNMETTPEPTATVNPKEEEVLKLEARLELLKSTHGELSDDEKPTPPAFVSKTELSQCETAFSNWLDLFFQRLNEIPGASSFDKDAATYFGDLGIDVGSTYAKYMCNPWAEKVGDVQNVDGIGFDRTSVLWSWESYFLSLDADGGTYHFVSEVTYWHNTGDEYEACKAAANAQRFKYEDNALYWDGYTGRSSMTFQQAFIFYSCDKDGNIQIEDMKQDLYWQAVSQRMIYPYIAEYQVDMSTLPEYISRRWHPAQIDYFNSLDTLSFLPDWYIW